ncbi:hypothetical protein [Peribacillus alkalitolerans]|uniref:hypothetical protein n=1 Tax=Peribacillus alkalitolerans TaxID=1550385 RepID=UPI0013D0759F|nr:hypothetical protein [Peribacillus alkalitolerans]
MYGNSLDFNLITKAIHSTFNEIRESGRDSEIEWGEIVKAEKNLSEALSYYLQKDFIE